MLTERTRYPSQYSTYAIQPQATEASRQLNAVRIASKGGVLDVASQETVVFSPRSLWAAGKGPEQKSLALLPLVHQLV